MRFISIKNWKEFQHYKDRNAPWFKMYGNIVSSLWWVMGSDASKLLALCTMLLAHRTDNKIPFDPKYIRRFAHLEKDPDFQPLIDAQFIEISEEIELGQVASIVLASCKQSAPRKKERKIDREEADLMHGFDAFWATYPKKLGKMKAEEAWKKAKINGEIETVIKAIKQARLSVQWNDKGGQFIPYPAKWLNEKRWLDEPQAAIVESNNPFAEAI